MKKYFIISGLLLFLISTSMPVLADFEDGTDLLIKQNETQMKINHYEVSRQLNEEKMNTVRALTQMDSATTKPNAVENIIQTRRQRDAKMYGKSYSEKYMR